LIVDDEPIARRVLREELDLFPEILIVGERRLRLCYGPGADLLIESSRAGTKVQFAIPGAAALRP
jgi:hypothetical protein